jgi:polysaccharide biosynthesis/export protein
VYEFSRSEPGFSCARSISDAVLGAIEVLPRSGLREDHQVTAHGHNVVSTPHEARVCKCGHGPRIAAEKAPVLQFRVLGCALLLAMTPALSHSQTVPAGRPAVSSLAPGDFIALDIWREPDLSDTVQVDNAGVAVFPKLGPLKVTHMSADSLERQLVRSYGEYLQNPSIRVVVLRRITVWGAVTRPGTYPVDLTMSVTDAVALAGGPNQTGKANKVELRRGPIRTEIDLSKGDPVVDTLSLRSGDQLYVPERSWVSRNLGLVFAAIGTATSLVYLVVRE